MDINQLKKWQECILAVQDHAEVVLMHRTPKDYDILFPDIDGDSYTDPHEHWKEGNIVSMTVPAEYLIRDELFTSDLKQAKLALQPITGIHITQETDQLTISLT